MVNHISIKELRAKLAEVTTKISEQFDRYIVTKRGKPEIVMMSIDDYESIMETLEIQSDPELMKRIAEAESDIEQGRTISLEDLTKRLEKSEKNVSN